MDQLSPDERKIGQDNYYESLGVTRREFLQGVVGAGAVSGAGLGAMYFGIARWPILCESASLVPATKETYSLVVVLQSMCESLRSRIFVRRVSIEPSMATGLLRPHKMLDQGSSRSKVIHRMMKPSRT